MEILQKCTLVLVIVGGINWGIVGLFNFNLVEFLFGQGIFTTIIYILVGISSIIDISILFQKLE